MPVDSTRVVFGMCYLQSHQETPDPFYWIYPISVCYGFGGFTTGENRKNNNNNGDLPNGSLTRQAICGTQCSLRKHARSLNLISEAKTSE